MLQLLKMFIFYYISIITYNFQFYHIYIYDLLKSIVIQYTSYKNYFTSIVQKNFNTVYSKKYIILSIYCCMYILSFCKNTFALAPSPNDRNRPYASQEEIMSMMSAELEAAVYEQHEAAAAAAVQTLQHLVELHGQLTTLEDQISTIASQQLQLQTQLTQLLSIPIEQQGAVHVVIAHNITGQIAAAQAQITQLNQQAEFVQSQLLQELIQAGMMQQTVPEHQEEGVVGGDDSIGHQGNNGEEGNGGGAAGGVATFAHGYDPLSQISSLQGLQYVLLDTSSHVSQALRSLIVRLQINSTMSQTNHVTRFKNLHGYKKLQNSTNVIKKERRLHQLIQLTSSCNVFRLVEGCYTPLECKTHNAQIGLVTIPTPKLKVGFIYNYNQDPFSEYKGMGIHSSSGKVKVKTESNTLLAVFGWNTDKPGFTGYFSSCYGWGRITTLRSFTSDRKCFSFKGIPDVTTYGGLVRLGYNFNPASNIVVTPYIEGLCSTVERKAYKEQRGYLFSRISHNKEQKVERGVGVSSFWKCTQNSALQAWIGSGLSTYNINKISSKIGCGSFSFPSLSAPAVRKTFFWREIGMAYNIQISEKVHFTMSGSHCLEKDKQSGVQNIKVHLQYNY